MGDSKGGDRGSPPFGASKSVAFASHRNKEAFPRFLAGMAGRKARKEEGCVNMLAKFACDKRRCGVLVCLFLVMLLACSLPVYAADPPYVTTLSAESILTNISRAVPDLMRLVTAFAYVLGMVFIFKGVVELKHMGEMRTQMSSEHHFAVPLSLLIAGTLLLYLPSAVQVGLSTFWTNPTPYGYETTGIGATQDQWAEFLNTCFSIIQLFGIIAFIRGLIILSHGGGHRQGGGMGKGLTHIIAGIFCINIYQLVQVIAVTIGIQM